VCGEGWEEGVGGRRLGGVARWDEDWEGVSGEGWEEGLGAGLVGRRRVGESGSVLGRFYDQNY
jgi:hypothetical protein